LFFEWQTKGLCLTTELQAVPGAEAIEHMERRIFQTVQSGEEIQFMPEWPGE